MRGLGVSAAEGPTGKKVSRYVGISYIYNQT